MLVNELDEASLDIAKETAKAVTKEVYADVGHPIAKPTGELVGLVPRAIRAALAPVEKWVLEREYNVAETKKLLEEKLKNIPPEQIEAPEAYIAVPALQNISYCMDNDELRDMYANLLANSMTSIVKNGVHPGFVDIIKQLSPDEAKILRYFATENVIPTITLRYENNDGSGISVVKNFSNVGELTQCENQYTVNKYFDNLNRLGLVESSEVMSSLTDKTLYEPLKKHSYIKTRIADSVVKKAGFEKYEIKEEYMSITDYGREFCNICISKTRITQG